MAKGCAGLAPLVFGALVAACGGGGHTPLTTADSVDVAAAVSPAPARTRPSDGQIARILNEANAAIVSVAQHARSRVTTPVVTGYTTTITADHQAIRTTLDSVARSLAAAAPAEHAAGRALREDAAAAIRELEAVTGATYEETYLEKQILLHERALSLIDDVLIPSAEDERLRTFVRNVRPAFAAHLQRALQIRQLIAAGTAEPDSGTTGS